MSSILIITGEPEKINGLQSGLSQKGFTCLVATPSMPAIKHTAKQPPAMVLVEINGLTANHEIQELPRTIRQGKSLPIIVLVTKETLNTLDTDLDVDDFVTKPYDINELALRIKRLLHRTKDADANVIKCGDLTIDATKCEVSVNGRLVELTFKEYQLLKFLASNRGRVFTRDALLNKVWGYDYYGGDRTVDVHIRRLRSKIEDSRHSFIDTVRNIGYRFNTRD